MKGNTHGKEDIDTDEDQFGGLERNLVGKELKKKKQGNREDRSRLTRLAASSRIPEKA